MSKLLKFQDWIGVSDIKLLSDAQQFATDLQKNGRKISLAVKVNATYSGYLLNGRTYPGTGMARATPTWTDTVHGGIAPYNAPVLLHHDAKQDPIGRVVGARYEKLWDDSRWQDDWKEPAQQFEKGSGYTKLTLDITDPDAIQKFIDRRYLTFSTNFRSHAVYCSICSHNVMEDKKICHSQGSTYDDPNGDGKLMCYYIAVPDVYTEVSVVNEPAQPHAVAESIQILEDAVKDSTIISQEELDKRIIPSSLVLPSKGLELMLRDNSTGDTTSLILKEGQKDAIPSGDGCIRSSKTVVIPNASVSLSPKGTKDNGVDSADDKSVMTDEDFAIAHIATRLIELGKLQSDSEISPDQTDVRSLEISYDKCWDTSLVLAGAPTEQLSARQREMLKSSPFCGPARSFPIPDSAHVTAATKLLGRYKGSADEKRRILDRIKIEAKKRGYEFPSDTGQQTTEKSNMAEANPNPTPGNAGAPSGGTTNEAALKALADQIAELREVNKQLQCDRDSKDSDLQKVIGELTAAKDELHKERCLRLATIRAVTTKNVDGKDLNSVKAVEEYADSLKARLPASIADALKDEGNVFNQKLPHLKGLPAFIADAARPEPTAVVREDGANRPVDKGPKVVSDKLDV